MGKHLHGEPLGPPSGRQLLRKGDVVAIEATVLYDEHKAADFVFLTLASGAATMLNQGDITHYVRQTLRVGDRVLYNNDPDTPGKILYIHEDDAVVLPEYAARPYICGLASLNRAPLRAMPDVEEPAPLDQDEREVTAPPPAPEFDTREERDQARETPLRDEDMPI